MNKTIWISLPLLGVLFFSSCEKIVEQKQKDILVSIMTSGQWYVESYIENTADISTDFKGYHFQFKENGTVDGLKEGNAVTGTWAGDIQNQSIKSNFPTAPDPLKKLNGNWKILNSSITYVEAEMSTINSKNILHLRKQP